MKIYFVRHGETSYNKEQKFQGAWTNLPLSETGEDQAERVAEKLRDDLLKGKEVLGEIYSSPSARAWQTAEKIARKFDTTPSPLPSLLEMHLGDWDHLTASEVDSRSSSDPENNPSVSGWKDDPVSNRIPGAETIEKFHARVMRGIDEIIFNGKRNASIIVVTHAGPIGVALTQVLHADLKDIVKHPRENASITVVEVDEEIGKARLISQNDVSHLK